MPKLDDPPRPAPPKRRFVHRIPIRLRQYWKLLALFVAVTIVFGALFGQTRIRPYITGDVTVMRAEITDNITGTVDLFDPDVEHTVTVDLSDGEYHDMISAYAKDGEKKWVPADITIDGTIVSDVAVRLKGNSTLMALRGDDFRPPGAPNGGPLPDWSAMSALSASADDPTSLPLLISFDQNAEGRGYQGLTELSVRPGTPVLNESLALSLTAATDQPTQRYAYTTYTINGQTTTRLILEHPDELFANELFDTAGYLYKADANSRLEFVGTDQSDYADQFKQINSADNGTLQPIINFLEWLDSADQEQFDTHLSDWIDVEAFARYLATQNLLANGDDMGGPGQNYYLWYDLETEKLTVIAWDLNLAMQGNATNGPHEEVQLPLPPGGMPPAAGAPGTGAEAPPTNPHPGVPRIGNQLKTRFLESAAFTPMYEDTYWDLYDQIYASGLAHELLEEIAATIPLTDGLSGETLGTAVDSMHSWIEERATVLDTKRGE